MKPKEPFVFHTLTGDDFRREIEAARHTTNEVQRQIRWLIAQKILADFAKKQHEDKTI